MKINFSFSFQLSKSLLFSFDHHRTFSFSLGELFAILIRFFIFNIFVLVLFLERKVETSFQQCHINLISTRISNSFNAHSSNFFFFLTNRFYSNQQKRKKCSMVNIVFILLTLSNWDQLVR